MSNTMEYITSSEKTGMNAVNAVMSTLLAFLIYVAVFPASHCTERMDEESLWQNVSSERITTAVGKSSICEHSEDQ